MKLTVVCVAVLVCFTFVEAGIIDAALQRQIDRIQAVIDMLQNREQSLTGQARDRVLERINRLRERLAELRKRGDKNKENETKEGSLDVMRLDVTNSIAIE